MSSACGAQVPLLCGAGWSALGGRAGAEYECGEELLGALSTARALPPRHPAHLAPDAAQRLLALFLDPPHYFTDEYGTRTTLHTITQRLLLTAHITLNRQIKRRILN